MNFYHCCGFDCVCVKTRHVYLYNSDDDNEGNDDGDQRYIMMMVNRGERIIRYSNTFE